MKRRKLILGLGALLLAGGGAANAAASHVPTQVWFEAIVGNPASCTDTLLEFECEENLDIPCLGEDISKPSSFNKQLYVTSDCDRPYEKPAN